MRRMQGIGLIIVLLIFFLIEYYSYVAFKFAIRSVRLPYRTYCMIAYVLLSVLWLAFLLSFPFIRSTDINKSVRSVIIVYSMGMLLSKLSIASILLIDDLRRGVFYVASLFYQNEHRPVMVENGMTRSAFITKMALLFGGTMFGTLLYGMSNRYNYNLKHIKLPFDNLPEAFHGLRIIHISDIHSGSFNNQQAVAKGVELIMLQKPDIILFTGDLVNNKSIEMHDYISIFQQLKAPLGVYSVFGNHDYGDYAEWESAAHKIQNLNDLKSIHASLGWRLLLDEHVSIEKDGQQIGIIGVENISAKGFQTYGNLANAYKGAENYPFKILLSHDPSHWDHETVKTYKDIDLTLSGHTHGMQFGVEIPGFKWSPVQYQYNRWAGLYQDSKQFLYVNRGFGFLGYPGRIGILPEVTLIELT